ncbi:MAG: response regulator [Thermodesulfobacteriota bacterium]|nr:response regulator [Thermodesulfobacteriota bacterium]
MKTIVIADDSHTARLFIKQCLVIIGFDKEKIIEVENGKDALKAVKSCHVDLLLTDLNMPVMDGETLVKWVKSSPKLSDMPVVVITSVGNPAKESHLLGLGVQAVLNKPVTPLDLQGVLGKQLTEQWRC